MWKTLGAPLSPFFQSARAVALRRHLSLLSNHQLRSPHCSSYLSQNNEGLTSQSSGNPWTAMMSCSSIFWWGFKVTEKVRKLIGWFLSHDLRCACGILKFEMFLSRCGADAPGKNERVAPRHFHYERAYRASTFEITNLSAQKTQYVNGPLLNMQIHVCSIFFRHKTFNLSFN